MRSLVVYESWFGNTRRIAEQVAEALLTEGEVEVVSVDARCRHCCTST
jgi:menaquinone-dependent protoporphyrinogen IX oxidase